MVDARIQSLPYLISSRTALGIAFTSPHVGSWGQGSTGAEVFLVCGGETICDDGFDNDGDLLVDCDDLDCLA